MTTRYAEIAGWGMYVPPKTLTNDQFVKMGLNTTNEWIASRTGIERRHIVNHEPTSYLAIRAGVEALQVSGTRPGDVDLVIVATSTPDYVMPATASLIQDRLRLTNAGAMDLNAACAGFVYALSTGAAQIESGRARQVLVIGADELSVHLDWKDRSTCVLFGDGAGAVLLRVSEEPGIMSSTMGSDGSGANLLTIKRRSYPRLHGNGAMPTDGYLKMNGPQIFRWATQMMAKAAEGVIAASGLTMDQVNLYIPHQANMRIMETTAKRLGLSLDKVFTNVKDYGNTSAASIPIALCEALETGRIRGGDNVVLTSFGAGLSWAAVALRWGADVQSHVTRWSPLMREIETRVAAARSLVRRQNWRVRATLDEKLRRDR